MPGREQDRHAAPHSAYEARRELAPRVGGIGRRSLFSISGAAQERLTSIAFFRGLGGHVAVRRTTGPSESKRQHSAAGFRDRPSEPSAPRCASSILIDCGGPSWIPWSAWSLIRGAQLKSSGVQNSMPYGAAAIHEFTTACVLSAGATTPRVTSRPAAWLMARLGHAAPPRSPMTWRLLKRGQSDA